MPVDGESVSIPKGTNLLVDVDSTAKLNAITVEGSLIFAPHPSNVDHLRTLDARIIMVQGGYVEMGTEAHPYTSKLQVTMHGKYADPTLPIYARRSLVLDLDSSKCTVSSASLAGHRWKKLLMPLKRLSL
jgi:hypothetical protein